MSSNEGAHCQPQSGNLRRRALLAATLLPALAGRCLAATTAAAAAAAPYADGATILIAGPDGGRLDRCADMLMPALERAFPAGTRLHRALAGAVDGVTGANRFEAQMAPDGATALLLPGAALLARLVGDPRAHFDAGRMIPVLAAVAPGVLLSRERLSSGATLRVAIGRPDGADLPGLLALDLLGVRIQPLFGLADAASVDAALANGGADAALVAGPDAGDRVRRLAQAGLLPALSLSVPGSESALLRAPAFADVPTLPELLGAPPAGALFAAWRATAVCAQLDWLLVLLSPTPAAMVALWRQAGVKAAPVLADYDGAELQLLACPAANQFAAPSVLDTAGTYELRRWLTERWHWQPA